MSKERECFGGGSIGPPRIPIPADLRVYMTSEEPIIGCNRIWCRDCESWVRHRDDTWLARSPAAPNDARWLFEHLDELGPPVVEPGMVYRLYACRCGQGQFTAVTPKELWTLEQSWACAGHPAGQPE